MNFQISSKKNPLVIVSEAKPRLVRYWDSLRSQYRICQQLLRDCFVIDAPCNDIFGYFKAFILIFVLEVAVLFPCQLWAGGHLQEPGDEKQALTSYYQGDFSRAINEYGRLLIHDKKNRKWAKDLAASLMASDRFWEAEAILAHAGLHGLELGEALLAAGDFEGAAQEFELALKNSGSQGRTYFLLGYIRYCQGYPAEAAQHLWQAQEVSPAQGNVHLFLGRSYHRLSEASDSEKTYFISRAQEEFSKAITVDASLWQVHRDLAYLAEQKQDWPAALRQWRKVRAVTGASAEIASALDRAKNQLPTPTITATPPVTVITSLPPAPMFENQNAAILPLTEGEPQIRVGLGKELTSLEFGCEGEWRALDASGKQLWEGRAKTGYRIGRDPAGKWVIKNWDGKSLKRIPKKISLEPMQTQKVMAVMKLYQTTGYMWSSGDRKTRYYRGRLDISLHKRTLNLINRVSLENYLLSLVPSEMTAEWPMEALKVQAIVARTDSLRRRNNHAKDGFDVCNNVHCAYYTGVQAENLRTYQAVFETLGTVLAKNGKLLPTFYSHSCGGITQSMGEAWGRTHSDPYHPQGVYDMFGNTPAAKMLPLSPGEIGPWLAGDQDVFCNSPKYSAPRNFRWFKILTQEELSGVLNQRYGVGTVERLQIVERTPSAYVRTLLVHGSNDQVLIRGDAIRSSLGGLRSNLFTLLPIPDAAGQSSAARAWLVSGAGWGHGVGLCQVGVGEMARRGYTYQMIIHHYFPDGELQAWP